MPFKLNFRIDGEDLQERDWNLLQRGYNIVERGTIKLVMCCPFVYQH